jgi:hypothetical protein
MVRRAAVLLLGLMLFFGSIGSVFADTPLNEKIDDLLGIKYKYGGKSEKGFDCSGFTGYVFAQLGMELPRSSRDQAKIGSKVAKKDLRKGDLLFFKTNGKSISHVGIYIGNGKMAHSSTSHGTTIANINDKYYANRYVTARRVLSEAQFKKYATEIEKNTEASAEEINHTDASETDASIDDEAEIDDTDLIEQ